MNRKWNALTYEGKWFVVGVVIVVLLCLVLGFMCGRASAESIDIQAFQNIEVGMKEYQVMLLAGLPSYTVNKGTASYTYDTGEPMERYKGHHQTRGPKVYRERVMWVYRGGRDNQFNIYLLFEDGVLVEKSRKRD